METEFENQAFTLAEHKARVDRARLVMAANGIDACVLTAPELLYYFTGYDAHTHHAIGSQALVLCGDDRVPLLIQRDGDRPQSDETVCFGEVKSFRLGSAALGDLVQVALDRFGVKGRIGIDSSNYTMNGSLTLQLTAKLGDRRVVDVTRLMGSLRVVLSPAEIEYIHAAATHAKAGLAAFLSYAKVGMSETQLSAEIEYAMRKHGSDYPAVPTWLSSGNRSHCQHGMAGRRMLESGDLIHAEFAGVARRYHCVTMATLVLGTPNGRMLEMAQGAKAAYEAGLAAAKIGEPVGLMERACFDELAARGLADTHVMRFGTGLSAAYPPIWENQISVQHESQEPLQEGMVFYIHSSMQDFEQKVGMLFGDSFLVTQSGPVALTNAPIGMVTKLAD